MRAVARSKIPVISAVGHETDYTLCDFAADCRAPTPSAAAELAVPDRAELSIQLDGLNVRMFAAVKRQQNAAEQWWRSVITRPVWHNPPALADGEAHRTLLQQRLIVSINRQLERRTDALRSRCAQLDALSPLKVMARGYAAVKTENWVMRAAQLTAGEPATMYFQDGQAVCTVRQVHLDGDSLSD